MAQLGKSHFRILIYIAAAALVAFVGWRLFAYFTAPSVTVTRLASGPVVQAFYATGTVRPEREFPIKASGPGTLEKVLVDKGDLVKQGQDLAVIDDPALKYAVNRAMATYEEAQRRADPKSSPVLTELDARIAASKELLNTARREVDRLEKLAESSSASIADRDRAVDTYQTRLAEFASLEAQRKARELELTRERDVAKAGYDTALWQFQQQTLKSPIDGVVLDRPTSQGTRVAVNDTLMRVADVRPVNLVMRAAVDEEDVTKCRVGQIVRMSLYAFEGEPITGHVKRIYDEADPERRTFEVDVAFDQPLEQLAAGMTGELAFIIDEKAVAQVLPSTALQGGAVWVVRDGRLVRESPKIGLKSFERIEIVSGLDENQQIVVSPIGELAAGERVKVTEIDPREAAGLVPKPVNNQSSFKGFN